MKHIDKFELIRKALENKDLSRSDFGVYCALLNYYNPNLGYAFPSRETLANNLCVGNRNVKHRNLRRLDQNILNLKEKGYIWVKKERKEDGKMKHNCYYFINSTKKN